MISEILTICGMIFITAILFSTLAVIFLSIKVMIGNKQAKKLQSLRDYDRKCKVEAMQEERVRI